MAFFKIPDNHVRAFAAISSMMPERYAALLESISDLNHPKPWLSSELMGLVRSEDKEMGQMVDALLSLFLKWQFYDEFPNENATEFVANVRHHVLTKDFPDLVLDPKTLEIRLQQLFENCSMIRSTVKAMDLNSLDNSLFDDFQILTDVRPVFFNDTPQPIQSIAIINHKLLFAVENESGSTCVEVVCTREQLELIHLTVKRALMKDTALRKNANFFYVDQ